MVKKNKNILFAEDPNRDLGLSLANQEWLVDLLKSKRLNRDLLRQSEVTEENVLKYMKKADLFHYHGHGYYDWMHPEESGLQMYPSDKDKHLRRVPEIARAWNGNRIELIILLSCVSGMTDVLNPRGQKQFVGLPATFLRSGANTIIGSLWPVLNAETCLIFSRFYQELLSEKKGTSPAEALRTAQYFVKTLSPKALSFGCFV